MPEPFELGSALSLEREALAALFNRVYSDYFVPLHLDAQAISQLVTLQDIDLERSRIARPAAGGGRRAARPARARGPVGGTGVVPSIAERDSDAG
jgi:hypothetical protein